MEISIFDFKVVAPVLILSAAAFLLLINEVTLKLQSVRLGLTTLGLFGSLLALLCFSSEYSQVANTTSAFSGLVFADTFSLLSTTIIIVGSIIAFLMGSSFLKGEGVLSQGEYYSLYLMSIVGAVILVSAREMILLFVGLEIMSIALYTMCSMNLWSSRSSEAGLKYFLMGSFGSALFLYGIALLYGTTGSLVIPEISNAIATGSIYGDQLLYVALGFIFAGLVFKIGIVPFHFWIPDVYQGAPTPVTVYMASVIKAAAVLVALRVLWIVFGSEEIFKILTPLIWITAVLTMTIGNLIALRQRSIKRMLAYSSIAHAGYMFVAFLIPGSGGGASVIFYLIAYMIMTFGSFGIVMVVSSNSSDGSGSDDISRFNGLGFRNPMLGVMMTIFMFSLAGLPPGLAGFLSKFYIFSAAIKADYTGLVIIAVINSAISCYYYLRVLVAMYFAPAENKSNVCVNGSVMGTLALCAVLAVLLGVFPVQVYDQAALAVGSLGASIP